MSDFKKLDPDYKARWVEALRSGAYRQGQFRLREAGLYCCLGVLCDLFDPGRWSPAADGQGGSDQYLGPESGLASNGMPPQDVRDGVGLERAAMDRLMDANDALGWDFGQIADWIEENL